MKKTTIEEYDSNGKLIKKTTIEEDTANPNGLYNPFSPYNPMVKTNVHRWRTGSGTVSVPNTANPTIPVGESNGHGVITGTASDATKTTLKGE